MFCGRYNCLSAVLDSVISLHMLDICVATIATLRARLTFCAQSGGGKAHMWQLCEVGTACVS